MLRRILPVAPKVTSGGPAGRGACRYATRPMTQFDFSPQAIAALAGADVQRALSEDVGSGDLTAGLIDPGRRARARVLVRESAVLCGSAWQFHGTQSANYWN